MPSIKTVKVSELNGFDEESNLLIFFFCILHRFFTAQFLVKTSKFRAHPLKELFYVGVCAYARVWRLTKVSFESIKRVFVST